MLSLATLLGAWLVVTALAGLAWALLAWFRAPTPAAACGAGHTLLRDGRGPAGAAEYKRCTACRTFRAVSLFYADAKGNLFYRCKQCVAGEQLARVPRPERVVVVDALAVTTPPGLSGGAPGAPPPPASGWAGSLHVGASAGRRGPGHIRTSPGASDASSTRHRPAAPSPSLGPSSSASPASSPPASVHSKASVPRAVRPRGDSASSTAPHRRLTHTQPGALCDPCPDRLPPNPLMPAALADRRLLESRADKEHFTREWLEGLAY